MRFVPVKIPRVIKRIFPNYVWDFSSNNKTLYLTFDDGPTPEITKWTLNILEKYNAKATFFCIGNNVAKHPEIFQSVLNKGHAVGNHTQDHVKGWKTDTNTYINNTLQAETIINNALKTSGKKVKLFRPPFGQIKKSQGKKIINLGYKIIMWSVITFDWEKEISKETCLKNAISKTKNGNIIVFHDSIKASKNMMYALPKFLEHFSKQGYQFKAINF
ncbi:polysaccharide deacetylase family protein [Lacinutrix sp. MedPE-SW]|uniref:polysaccharide deacetylase family protein n=1 Tax=Lacinutrix sp. MedPE-SW TaxID=1860087 RepID=UPI000914FC5E|nr:polysaccharide deacetylase family protein [Lacinutrix sp. MedPE-SW]OIQ23208.1 MAG: polysaccharide deacetylase family protein [Lacinutrix sp. MedPE-SW]